MSDFKINSIATKQGQHGPVIAGVSTINSTGCMKIPSGPTEFRGGRGRGVVAGGSQPSPVGNVNTMEFIEIATTGNSTDFGDFNQSVYFGGTGFASATRGLFAGGYNPNVGITDIGFFTFSSSGGANDFGDMAFRRYYPYSPSDSTRGLISGGKTNPNNVNLNSIEFVTMASTGDSSEFGDITDKRNWGASVNSPTRGLFGGGRPLASNNSSYTNIIDFVTIQTKGNALDFGNLVTAAGAMDGCSSTTRGLWGAKYIGSYTAAIDFVTMATFGNASDFGDLTRTVFGAGGMSNSIRGVWAGGQNPSNDPGMNVMDFVTIATTGNASDFGDLTAPRGYVKGCADSHGGIGE